MIEPATDGEDRSDDSSDVHVMPNYGREHEASRRCWCVPTRDTEEPRLWIHRDPN